MKNTWFACLSGDINSNVTWCVNFKQMSSEPLREQVQVSGHNDTLRRIKM